MIVDECHHLSAFTFEQVLKQAKAKYVLGLTATPIRKDGHQPIIYMQCGRIRFNLSARKAAEASPFSHSVIPRYTDFAAPVAETEATIHDLYAGIIADEPRNELIIADVRQALREGRSPLVLTGRTEHLSLLAAQLTDAPNVVVLSGGMGNNVSRSPNGSQPSPKVSRA